MSRGIQDIQYLLRLYLKHFLKEGDKVVDATAGRGRDTLFLAKCVGQTGKVYAFDIQEEAVHSTKKLLKSNGLLERVEIYCRSHTEITEVVHAKIRAAVFNLGYLPGSDRKIITRPQTTISAIEEILKILEEKGVIVITVYRGHKGGLLEAQELEKYLSEFAKKDFSIIQGKYINQGDSSPYWIIIQKNRRIADENPSSDENSGVNHK